MPKVTIHFKVWLKINDNAVFGKGKAELLRHIRDTGSINKAAKQMKISYRQAWRITHKITERFDHPILIMKKGGLNGGGTKLTPYAENLLIKFERLEQKIQRLTEQTNGAIFNP